MPTQNSDFADANGRTIFNKKKNTRPIERHGSALPPPYDLKLPAQNADYVYDKRICACVIEKFGPEGRKGFVF